MNRYFIRWEKAERVWSVWETETGQWVGEFELLHEAEAHVQERSERYER